MFLVRLKNVLLGEAVQANSQHASTCKILLSMAGQAIGLLSDQEAELVDLSYTLVLHCYSPAINRCFFTILRQFNSLILVSQPPELINFITISESYGS